LALKRRDDVAVTTAVDLAFDGADLRVVDDEPGHAA